MRYSIVRQIPREAPVKMEVEEASLLEVNGEPNLPFENFVQPTGSGARRADNEKCWQRPALRRPARMKPMVPLDPGSRYIL